MEEPRLFATYVDELKLVGHQRFASRISCPMLLVRTIDTPEQFDDDPAFETKVTMREELAARAETAADRARDATPKISPGQVLRVEKRPGAAFPDRVGIGRAPNVDVRIPVAQVSKYHAYISRDGGTFLLTDAGSSNGTSVRGVDLVARAPIEIPDGVELAFGGCNLRFYTPDGFVRFVASRVR